MTSTIQRIPPAHAVHGARRTGADLRGDLLAEAFRAEAAPPVAIHLRPELRELLRAQAVGPAAPPSPLPLVVDDELPASPGYEIHREPPAGVPPASGLTPAVGRPSGHGSDSGRA
ncbi:hypothetical protein [Blastococcus litoris]|uniref:hypothetical protein n=1 Tax=Blastococcus litoris TaxID=2171622 RepID=UPI000E302646|nr:hypothetical protein [Blastococcus litoris]